MATRILINPTLDSVTTPVHVMLPQNESIPSTLVATGLAGAGSIKVQISVDEGVSFHDIYINGTLQEMTATNNVIGVDAPGYYRFIKTATSPAAGLYLIYGRS
jgi:hypothetical protein